MNQDHQSDYKKTIQKKSNISIEIPVWRKILYSIIAVVGIPILFFIILETGLRLTGCGYSTAFFLPTKIDGQKAYITNWQFGWCFFPKKTARKPLDTVVAYTKPNDVYRVFLLGSSAAQGDPHPQYSFLRILQIMLEDQYPVAKFEMINTGMTAINSYSVREIVRDAAKLQPDLFIIYTGNNEVLGPFGAGNSLKPVPASLFWIRTGLSLQSTRIGQLMDAGITRFFSAREQPATWNGMKRFDQLVQCNSEPLKRIYANFQTNMRDILSDTCKSGAKVIVSTLGVNLKDCAPFASLHKSNLSEMDLLEWTTFYEKGLQFEGADKKTEALEAYLAANEIDDQYAALQYRIARIYYHDKNYEQALKHFETARDTDALQFRADSTINAVLRDAAKEKNDPGITLLDFAKLLKEKSPNGIPGQETFYEHVHLNFNGNYLVALQLAETMSAQLPEFIKKRRLQNKKWLSQEECEAQLAYTGFDRYETYSTLMERIQAPPFTYQMNYSDQVESLRKQMEELFKIPQEEAIAKAREIYKAALAKRPDDYYLLYYYANLLINANEFDEAIRQFDQLQKINPYDPANTMRLGDIYAKQKRADMAVMMYDKTLQIRPDYSRAMYSKAMAVANGGDSAEAIQLFEEFLKIFPDHIRGHLNIAMIYDSQNKPEKCLEHLAAALQIDPKDKVVLNQYGVALAKKGKMEDAIIYFKKSLQIDPAYAAARKNLAMAMQKLNK